MDELMRADWLNWEVRRTLHKGLFIFEDATQRTLCGTYDQIFVSRKKVENTKQTRKSCNEIKGTSPLRSVLTF